MTGFKPDWKDAAWIEAAVTGLKERGLKDVVIQSRKDLGRKAQWLIKATAPVDTNMIEMDMEGTTITATVDSGRPWKRDEEPEAQGVSLWHWEERPTGQGKGKGKGKVEGSDDVQMEDASDKGKRAKTQADQGGQEGGSSSRDHPLPAQLREKDCGAGGNCVFHCWGDVRGI